MQRLDVGSAGPLLLRRFLLLRRERLVLRRHLLNLLFQEGVLPFQLLYLQQQQVLPLDLASHQRRTAVRLLLLLYWLRSGRRRFFGQCGAFGDVRAVAGGIGVIEVLSVAVRGRSDDHEMVAMVGLRRRDWLIAGFRFNNFVARAHGYYYYRANFSAARKYS